MDTQIAALLSLGFGLGLLHALDADHVMAVTSLTLNAKKTSRIRATLAFCARWAMGHGGVLCLLAAGMLFFDLAMPEWMAQSAEKLIGVILIVLGAWIIWQLRRHGVQLRIHRHGEHVHAHLADKKHPQHSLKEHSPTLVGIAHGLAGSAPLLALLPTLELSNPMMGFAYVLLFSVGVLTMMFLFGLSLGYAQQWLERFSHRLFNGFRAVVGCLAISLGTYWLSL